MIFESHAHYDDKQFDIDRQALLKELPEKGIGKVLNVGCDMMTSRKTIELAKTYSYIYAGIGFHPSHVGEMKDEDLEGIMLLARYEKVVAIGEIGLDYYYDTPTPTVQKLWFRHQLHIARDLNLPVIIHSREASQDCYDIIMNNDLPAKGVIHCFSGSVEMAKNYIKNGFYIGVGGVVTFNNAKKLVDVVSNIPIESILVETDCPYLAPAPNRGKRNDSRNIPDIINKIAQIKSMKPEEVEAITYNNAMKLFGLK